MIRRSWMAAGSIETTLELWASSFREVKGRIRPLFQQARMAVSAGLFLDALLGPERRKTGWMRAEAAGDPGPWRQQALLDRSRWDADALRDVVRGYAGEALGEADSVLVIDETGFLKQGKASCGVGRQYTGSAGKITHCQIGGVAAYVSDQGHAFIDRQLYLPKAWTGDPARMRAAQVPEAIAFAPKPQLALAMIERAIQAEVPFAWVAADRVCGVGEIELALRRADKGYVLGVTGQHRFWSWDADLDVAGTAEEIAKGFSETDWIRLSAGAAPRGRACSTGPIGRWPRSRRMRSMPLSIRACGRAACWCGAASRTGLAPTSPPGARPARRSRGWWRWKGGVGRSRRRSRPPRRS